MPAALAIAAHPDDIEFVMAGTLILLQRAGWEIHYFNVSTGNLGSMLMNSAKTARTRRREAQRAARLLGATWYAPVCNDLSIFYDEKTLRKVAAVVRAAKPSVILTHSPQDYMEDHMNSARLAVTAAFAREFTNYRTTPARAPVHAPVTIYHAQPHGNTGPLRQPIVPDFFVNIASARAQKREALACHESQKHWLDETQGMDSYLVTMDEMNAACGRMSRRFASAEGWRRHQHAGFCAEDTDPLRDVLGALTCTPPKSRGAAGRARSR